MGIRSTRRSGSANAFKAAMPSHAPTFCHQAAKIQGDGEVAQLGERVVRNDEVGSSILLFSTTYRRPTVLGWAFSFAESAHHAGFPPVLRVPAAGRQTAPPRPVRPCSALSSLETCANFFAVALADGVVHQPLVRVPTRRVGSRVCTSNAERQTREASLHVSPWAGTGRHRSCCAHGSGHHALG